MKKRVPLIAQDEGHRGESVVLSAGVVVSGPLESSQGFSVGRSQLSVSSRSLGISCVASEALFCHSEVSTVTYAAAACVAVAVNQAKCVAMTSSTLYNLACPMAEVTNM